jgi:formate hydrogenlyase subunit 3/multisubunit Na+/H+ antiporter MnhD subunit
MWAMAALSLIAGLIVIVYSYKIHKEPEKIRECGFVILIASIVGAFCASGFGVGGAVLGIIVGVSSLKKEKTK